MYDLRATGVEFLMHTASSKDLEGLLTIENACFNAPWTRKHFEAELEGNRFSHIVVVPHPRPKTASPSIVAYICAWIIFEEVRFLNLAVLPDFRRRGVAQQLIQEMLRRAVQENCQRGLLEVRESNSPALNLYKSLNFKEYARRNAYYTNPSEDAILMRREPIRAVDGHA